MSLRHTVSLHDYRGNRIDTAPAVEPVTADELRTHLREESETLPDAEAEALIKGARQWIEDKVGVAFITQTWVLTMDRWPSGRNAWWDGVREGHINIIDNSGHLIDVEIPRWPMQSISGINVYDEDGDATAVTVADVFDVDTSSIPARISLQRGATWPIALRANNAIEITYVSGYGDAASDIPHPLKRAVKQLAAALYTNRGDCESGDMMKISGAASIMRDYKVARI